MFSFKSFLITILVIILFPNIVISQWGWQPQTTGTTINLNSIDVKGRYGWAAGNNGLILATTNGGINWFQQTSGVTYNLNSIVIRDTLSVFIAGDNGTILRTTNAGINWLILTSGTTINLKDISLRYITINNIYVAAVGENGKIIRSTNNGTNWVNINSGTTKTLNFVDMYDTMFCLAGGAEGTLLSSGNYGASWYSVNSGTTANLSGSTKYSIPDPYYFEEYHYLICGDNGTLLHASTPIFQWNAVPTGLSNNLKAIKYCGFTFISMIDVNGNFYKSSNYGLNWILQTNTANQTNDLVFSNTNSGWASGNNGKIFHTKAGIWYSDYVKFEVNNIRTWYSNNGTFNHSAEGIVEPGCEYPKGSNKFARYTSGLWIGAKVDGDTLVSRAEFNFDFLPGYTDNNGIASGADNYQYRNYILKYGINDSNRAKWPNSLMGNSNQGAPVFFDTQSQTWKAIDFGDQTTFCSYTDGYAFKHNYYVSHTAPLKADIKQLNFAFNQSGGIGNSIISYYTIINRSNKVWSDAYITIWSDDDIGDGTNDKAGCDTNLQLGYTYNGSGYDPEYGSTPPAAGLLMLKGPVTYTGNNNDTAYICEGKTKKIKTKYKQSGWGVFNTYTSMISEPNTFADCYNYIKGCDIYGNPYFNVYSNQITTFPYSGEPQVNNGWVMEDEGDKRMLISAGPMTMNPGDTQVIVAAQVLARGTSYYNSIVLLRQYSQEIINHYKNCFNGVPIGIENEKTIINEYRLEQNYPNPFNPSTKITFHLPENGNVKITVYDLLGRELAVLVNEFKTQGKYSIEFSGSNLSSGVYFYTISAGKFITTRKMLLLK